MKKYTEHISQIDELLRFKNTGCANELAERLGVSRSTQINFYLFPIYQKKYFAQSDII